MRGAEIYGEEFAEFIYQIIGGAVRSYELLAENHMLLLGRKTSLEKVAAFLIEMDRRLAAADVMELPMNRQDIADYLGLSLETVSRALSVLHDEGVLNFVGQTQRQILLLNRGKLALAAA